MVKIDIGPYRLESYSDGWTIGVPRMVKRKDQGTGEVVEYEKLVGQTYPGSLTAALTSLQDRWLRESSASSCGELLGELKLFKAELAGLFELQVREPDRDRPRRTV